MKAVTWRRRVSTVAGALALALVLQPALADKPAPGILPGLPPGLPDLPQLGEVMQRDLRSGLALSGYDPVAYHIQARATPGRADYEFVHRGAVWRFASAANREAFREAPAVYEPAFAGFDPTGVAEGRAVDSDPREFAVVGSRLFLFRTARNRADFLGDPTQLRQAETHWRDVYELVAR